MTFADAAGELFDVAVGLGSDERILLGWRGGRALQLKIQRAHEAVGRKTLVCDDLDLRRITERRADGPLVSMQILEAYDHGVRFSKNRGCETRHREIDLPANERPVPGLRVSQRLGRSSIRRACAYAIEREIDPLEADAAVEGDHHWEPVQRNDCSDLADNTGVVAELHARAVISGNGRGGDAAWPEGAGNARNRVAAAAEAVETLHADDQGSVWKDKIRQRHIVSSRRATVEAAAVEVGSRVGCETGHAEGRAAG